MASQPHFHREYHPLQLSRPSQDQIDECTTRTAAALGLIDPSSKNNKSINSSRQNLIDRTNPNKPTYISYTSQISGQQRFIEIHDMNDDPLSLSKFKTNKTLKREPSPPPISFVDPNTSKTSQAELAKWKLPTAVSNWTNNKAGVVDLSVRALFDYDANHSISISSKLASLSSTLDKTLKQNREEILARSSMQQSVEQAKREKEERDLQQHASRLQKDGPYQPTLHPTMQSHQDDNDDNTNQQNDYDDLSNLDDAMARASNEQQKEILEKEVRQVHAHNEARNRLQSRYQSRKQRQDGERVRQRDMSEAITSTAIDNAATNTQVGGNLYVDDQVAQSAAKQSRDYNEDPHDDDDDENQSTKSKAFHNISGTVSMMNNGLGKGALTRETPVLFEKHTTISATNPNQNNSNNNTNNDAQRNRDRNYEK